MLETVTKGFRAAKNRLAGKSELTPELVDESLLHATVKEVAADSSMIEILFMGLLITGRRARRR